ncbi:MAG: glycoside hydrolase family 16 protein, partial [Armatimonadota bacterium]|nr:glycoside hydrolase family 16 protein [Armatimonadota bacterium]
SWDLSAFGHVEARVTNTGAQPLNLSLRVDNAGDWKDNPWNTESVSLKPGETGTVTTIFGYSYGKKPGYALKPGAVVNLLLFTGKSDAVQSFRIESLTADGPAGEKPPVAPQDVRVKPANGVLTGETTVTPTEQTVKPTVGRWDLRAYLGVRVRVRNTGQTTVTPRAQINSNGGASDWVSSAAPLAPGATTEIWVPFAGLTPADLPQKNTGSHITSDAVSAVTLAVEKTDDVKVLHIESLTAALSPFAALPSWLGKRPPVDGAWVKTLDDEFNGTTLNKTLWNIYGANYWDKPSHWSKDNVIVGGGVVRLRYEKKTGFNNDDPTQKSTPYASGYLHTYDRWTQRYGYFEARMKLPTAPGLWPAFWMMPDRGVPPKPGQWKRQDTANGGMEFDIMEHLTRWGPNRYNIAMHYDGYGKDHKSVGTDKIYVQPDKDGYFTCGLLWTPGLAVYYCNGREVLRWENPRISSVPEILMFTLPQGGWDNSPIDDKRLPDDFIIDYVRVWQRKDLTADAADPKPASPK